jgi:hypothetical protein
MPRKSGLCSVVVTVEVVAPLTPALDGGAAVFSLAMALELGPKDDHGEACHCWRECCRCA